MDFGSSYLPSELNAAYLYAQLEARDRIFHKRMEIYNYYNENALDVQTIEGKSLDLSVLGRTILLGKAVDRVELYNVSGCLISLTENSNHISAPGIGMYIVRIVTEGKVFSQKIWINR